MRQKTNNSQRFYDQESSIYDSIRLQGDGNTVNHILQLKIIKKFVSGLGRKIKVLEIAPGTGRITEVLAQAFDEVTAVDISSEMLATLKKKKWYSEKISLHCSDVASFEIDVQYDLIIFINAASHMDNFESVLKWASRHLTDTGIIFYNFPNLHSLYYLPGLFINLRHRSLLRNVFTRWYSLPELSEISGIYQLNCLRYAGITHAPLGTPRLLRYFFLIFNRFSTFNQKFGSQVFVLSKKV